VDILIDEVTDHSKQLPPGKMFIYFRSLLCDIVAQLSYTLDGLWNRRGSPAELCALAVRLIAALKSAYEFVGIKPAIPSKTLMTLAQVGKLMAKPYNSGS
jgi:hypothetical protein